MQDTQAPLITLPPQTPTYDADRDEELKALREEMLEKIQQNNNVLISAHYSLLGIAELIDISRDIFKVYSYYVDNLKISNENYNLLKASLATSAAFINQSLTEISSMHKSSLELYAQSEQILDTTQAELSALDSKLEMARFTLEKIQEIQESMTEIEHISFSLKAMLQQATDIKLQIEVLAQNLLHNMQVDLLATKEGFEKELYDKKEEYCALFNEKLQLMQEKSEAFMLSYQKAKSEANIAIQQVEAFKEQLVKYYHQANIAFINALSRLESYKEEKAKELEAFKEDKKHDLDLYKEEKTQELESYKDAKAQDLESCTESHIAEIGRVKDAMLREIRVLNTAEILALRELFYTIQGNVAVLGSDYQGITFTESTTFMPIKGIKNYFVFVRGGNGGDNSDTSGGITSFGSYLSVSGGAGNQKGVGQRGESKCAFITLDNDDEINVIVSSGGICTISYAGSEAVNFDFSFLTREDLSILSLAGQSPDEFIESISNTRDYNYYQSLVSIANGLNLDSIPELESGQNYAFNHLSLDSKRALALSIARAYLDNAGEIDAYLESVEII